MDPTLIAQMQPYTPWLLIAGVFSLFTLLRVTRKFLRQRVEEIGYWLTGQREQRIWFWLNAPGVILHELSHAFVLLLLRPFGFRITSIAFFHIKPIVQRVPNGRIMKSSMRQSLQLGEVQYVRPQGRPMTYIGDGLSAIAPLFGGIAMFLFLYWVATGYTLWDAFHNPHQILHPGWPWWTLIFAPYLILTVTSELWPSRQDWRGARWLITALLILILGTLTIFWVFKWITFNNTTLQIASSIASHIDFALFVLLALDAIFLILAEAILRATGR